MENYEISDKSFEAFFLYKERRKLENSHRCDIRKIDVHRASFAKHLRSKKHSDIIKQDEMIIPEWLCQQPIGNEPGNEYNSKTLKQLNRWNIKRDDRKVN